MVVYLESFAVLSVGSAAARDGTAWCWEKVICEDEYGLQRHEREKANSLTCLRTLSGLIVTFSKK